MTRVAVTPGDECPAVTVGAAGAGTPGLRGSRRGAGSRAAPGPAPEDPAAAGPPCPPAGGTSKTAAAGPGPLKEILDRYRELIAEIGWLLEVELLTPFEAARRRHQARVLFEASVADALAWQAATGC